MMALRVPEPELVRRRKAMDERGDRAWKPLARDRFVPDVLKLYAATTSSASLGAARDLGDLCR